MKTLATISFLCIAIVANLATAQTNYIVGMPTPSQLSQADKLTALNALNVLLGKTKAGDRISVYDAAAQKQIRAFTLPEGPLRLRNKNLGADLQAIMREFNTPKTDQPSIKIDLPRFASEVIRPAHRDGATTRVLIFGGLFKASGGDASAAFEPGEYPGDGFIWATNKQTPWGTNGKSDQLKNVTVFWCYFGEAGSNPEREAATEFYGKWFGAQNGTLVDVLPNGQYQELVKSVLNGNSEPLVKTKPDPTDRRIVIRRVGEAKRETADRLGVALTKARAKVDPKALAAIKRLEVRDEIAWGQTVDLVFVIDASRSWEAMQPTVHASIESAARIIPDYSPHLRVSVIPFREKTLDRFKLATIKSQRAVNGDSHTKLGEYMATIKAEGTKVHIEEVSLTTLNELKQSPGPGRTVWCFITDQDPLEWDSANTEGADRITAAVTSWAKGKENRVVSVYVGQDPNGSQATFMKSLATAAGDKGLYTQNVDGLIESVIVAALRKSPTLQ